MKRLIPLLLTAMAIIFASVGLGYSYMASNFSGIKTTEEKKERKVYTRGDGTKAELVEQNPWLFRQYIVSIPTPEIIAVPGATAVTFPPETVAIAVSDDLHTTLSVVLKGVTFAVNVEVLPLLMLREVWESVIPVAGTLLLKEWKLT